MVWPARQGPVLSPGHHNHLWGPAQARKASILPGRTQSMLTTTFKAAKTQLECPPISFILWIVQYDTSYLILGIFSAILPQCKVCCLLTSWSKRGSNMAVEVCWWKISRGAICHGENPADEDPCGVQSLMERKKLLPSTEIDCMCTKHELKRVSHRSRHHEPISRNLWRMVHW